MKKIKMKDMIRDDLSSIRSELIENAEVFILNLIKSLRPTQERVFSAYKVDLSLYYLKQAYERAFPWKKHGGSRVSKVKKSVSFVQDSLPEQVTTAVTWVKGTDIVDRAIVINLFKGIRYRGKAPSFVKLIELRSKLSRPVIQDRIRVGSYIVNCTEVSRSILLFRSNKISHTKFLTEIKRKEKKLDEMDSH